MGAPGGETGGQASAAGGLEITPGVGSGTPGGDGSGSPALLLSAIGTKGTLISVQRGSLHLSAAQNELWNPDCRRFSELLREP